MRHSLLLLVVAVCWNCAAQVPDYVPTDGLVAWYPFNGDATDASGNGHDGTVEGAILANDRFSYSNGAYFFDGDDRIFPANPEGYPLQERTTSIWMKSNVPVTGGRTLMGYGGSSCGNSWLLTYNNLGNQPYTSNAFEIQGHCNYNSVAAPLPSIEFTNWHFVTIRTSAAGTDVFIDGVLGEHSSVFIDDTAPGCAVFGGVPSLTGGCYYQDANVSLWNGWLDDIGIWNRALSDEEIAGLYNAPPPIAGCTDPNACNHDSAATLDDDSCEYGCLYCGAGTIWNPTLETCVAAPPELDTSGNCTLFDLQELAEGYQILLTQNAVQDSLILALQDSLSNCSNFTEDGSTSAEGPCVGQDHVTFDGYDYSVVGIGDQCWFAENLRTESYSDGSALDTAHYAAFNNSSVSIDSYGLLYKGAAITDSRNLCPTDWHISTLLDWQSLEAHATANGHDGAEAAALKSTSGWSTGNGSDAFGFNATPGGFHYNPIHPYWGEFAHSLTSGYWWTSTPHSTGRSYAWTIQDNLASPDYAHSNGLSVRCVKN